MLKPAQKVIELITEPAKNATSLVAANAMMLKLLAKNAKPTYIFRQINASKQAAMRNSETMVLKFAKLAKLIIAKIVMLTLINVPAAQLILPFKVIINVSKLAWMVSKMLILYVNNVMLSHAKIATPILLNAILA